MSSTNKRYITLEQAVANAETIIDKPTELDRVIMRQWVYLAQNELGIAKENIQTVSIKADDLSIRKPDDFVMGDEIALYNSADQELVTLFRGRGKRVHKEFRTSKNFPVDISESADYYHLGSNGDIVACASLRYYSLPIDGNDNVLIPQRNMLATMLFVRYMWAMRNNVNESAIEANKVRWERQAAKVRAKNILPDQLEFRNGIMKTYMSMISAPQRETF